MTDRLYYTDAYLTHFDARVVERAGDGRRVYLDRTAFYPTSGGQPHDIGSLGGIAVLDVVDEDERIAHLLAAPLAAEQVTGTIDWPRRFDHMQQHTGQHLLSAVFADEFGYDTVSVHFGPDYATLDLSTESVSHDELVRAERRANEIVCENLAVEIGFEEARSVVGLRKATDRDGTIRVVTIRGLDRSACGGTHLRATGEIGTILLRRQEKMRKNARVEFLCGARAIRRARADFDALSSIASGLSASIDELAVLVPAQAEAMRTMQNTQRRLEDEVAGFRAASLYASTACAPDGNRYYVERRQTGRAEDVRAFALAFAAQPKAVYAALLVEPRAVLLAASGDAGFDCGKRLKEALATVNGKGGGSPRLAQGNVPDLALLERVLSALGIPT
jgi:alanyl-tRNA synthetase